MWNPSLSIPEREFEFTDAEVARIKAAIETWSNYGVANDRRWLEPLLEVVVIRTEPGPLALADRQV